MPAGARAVAFVAFALAPGAIAALWRYHDVLLLLALPLLVRIALCVGVLWRLGRWQLRLARRAEASVRRRREAFTAWRDVRAMACALPPDATRVAERDGVTEGSWHRADSRAACSERRLR